MNNFFIAGGTVGPEKWNSYIEREADDVLYNNLSAGNFCYILTSRQMGKTSLAKRTSHKLKKKGLICIYIELNLIGRSATEDQWYLSISDKICNSSGIEFNLKEWWEQNDHFTSLERFSKFIEYLIKHTSKKIVVFIDEIDLVLSIDKFRTDDFFAAIRGIHEERTSNTVFNKITFALIGVAAPSDLMKDPQRTPFNIGVAIPLHNLDRDKAYPVLSKGLPGNEELKKQIIQKVFEWTGGQPYLTQVLCMRISESISIENPDHESQIENIITNAIYNESKITEHLGYIEKRILGMPEYTLRMLGCYQKIFNGEEIKVIANDPTQIYLRLAGLVLQDKDRLVINNLLYKNFFNETWINDAFLKNNKFYPFLKQWLDSNKTMMPAKINEKLLNEYKQWADTNAANIENLQFINYCTDKIYKKEKRQRRTLEISAIILFSLLIVGISIVWKKYTDTQLKSFHETRKQQEALANTFLNRFNQESEDSTKVGITPKSSARLQGLRDSLNTLFDPKDITIKLIDLYINNTDRIIQQKSEIESLKKLVDECIRLHKDMSTERLPPASMIPSKRKKVAVITICDNETGIQQYESGRFYTQLTNDVQRSLSEKYSVIPASDINKYITQQNINLCAQSFKSREIASQLNSDICVRVEFSIKSVIIQFIDVPGNKDFAPEKTVQINNFNNYNDVKSLILRQITLILK